MLKNHETPLHGRGWGRLFHSRLAPTPSGFLHVGNAFSFILTWLLVRKSGGTILLRIDDLDSDRVRPEYIADVFETLDWLGLDWDTGPQSTDEFNQRYSQKLRLDLYHHLLHRLRTETELVYACRCSRSSFREGSTDGLYSGVCLHQHWSLTAPEVAWRIHVPELAIVKPKSQFFPMHNQSYNVAALLGDFVIRRKDGIPAYQIASVADDLHFGINAIVRGADLLPSTVAQLWLADVLQLKAFTQSKFYHHPLLTDTHGQKISKSTGATSLRAMREVLPSPAILFQKIAYSLGLSPEGISTALDLLQRFDFQWPETLVFD